MPSPLTVVQIDWKHKIHHHRSESPTTVVEPAILMAFCAFNVFRGPILYAPALLRVALAFYVVLCVYMMTNEYCIFFVVKKNTKKESLFCVHINSCASLSDAIVHKSVSNTFDVILYRNNDLKEITIPFLSFFTTKKKNKTHPTSSKLTRPHKTLRIV